MADAGRAAPVDGEEGPSTMSSRCAMCFGTLVQDIKGTPASIKAFFVTLVEGYGARFVAMLAIVYFCVKGFANNATSYALLPFYRKSLKVDASDYQKYYNVANMAFSIKPLVGVVSDLVPIFGFHKRFYIVLLALLGAGCLFCVTLLPESDKARSGPSSAGLLFVFFSGVAGMDLLMEGKYSEIMNNKLAPPSVVSFVWLVFSAGSLLGTGIEGPLADYASPEVVLWIAAPVFALATIPAFLGWLPEKRRKGGMCGSQACGCLHGEDDSDVNSVTQPLATNGAVTEAGGAGGGGSVYDDGGQRAATSPQRYGSSETVPEEERRVTEEEADGGAAKVRNAQPALSIVRLFPCILRSGSKGYSQVDGDGGIDPDLLDSATQHKGIAALGILTACCSLSMALITLLADQTVLLAFICPAVVVLVTLSMFILPKAAALANIYMFARELSYLQVSGFLDYFFTSDEVCLPNGPNFSFTYYQTSVNIISSVGTFLGAILFQKFLSGMTFRRVFWLSNTLKIFASLFDLVLTRRWNVAIGINDHVMFLCGDAIIYPICSMLDFMPASVLLSRLCPPGMECTMFALLASFSNFGQSISRSFGYMLAERLGIRSESTADNPLCNFDKLWLLVVIGHIAMPAANYVFAFLFIPDTPMTRNVSGAGAAEIEGDSTTPADEVPEGASARRTTSNTLAAALLRRSGAFAPQGDGTMGNGTEDPYSYNTQSGAAPATSQRKSLRASHRQRAREREDVDEEDPYRTHLSPRE